jgi:hypothetical protein
MDTKEPHSPAQIVWQYLSTVVGQPAAPAPLYYHRMPAEPVDLVLVSNSEGVTGRAHRGRQNEHHGVQIMGRAATDAKAREWVSWACAILALPTPSSPAIVTLGGVAYRLCSCSRFGTLTDLGQTEKNRHTMATQDFRVTIQKG